jgi:hypothetical protein
MLNSNMASAHNIFDVFISYELNIVKFGIKEDYKLVFQEKTVKKKVKLSRYTPWRHMGGEEA